ncbi:Asp23/Gls24 family envelope stress response protein [Marisediminicola sp. LYQ85]|uniref:Asp23/Gls24 family envelope stress response protein n=1 Tax=Marisediminicola sp. LYQ85 TaxID=3391062 RepID=UPI003983B0E6
MATTSSAATPNTAPNAAGGTSTAKARGTMAQGTTDLGTTVIDDGVVAKVAGIAAREVPGVFELGGGAARALGAIRSAVNSTDLAQGVAVEVGETQVAVDISLVAEYPVALQTVADNVRSSVRSAIESLVGMEVTEVNVTINDVHVPSDDDTAEADTRVS